MNLSDKIWLQKRTITYDENLNAQEQVTTTFIGKCIIVQSSAASKWKSNDGDTFEYSYIVYLRKPKDYANIPRENEVVRIVKKDGTIDTTKKVKGFQTLRNWLRIWL